MTDSTSAQIADEIAELVRRLNYQTGAGGSIDLSYHDNFYSVIANLKLAVLRLPQLFDQMAQWLTAEHAAGRIAHDHGENASEYVAAVVGALGRADRDVTALFGSLDAAHEMSRGLKAS